MDTSKKIKRRYCIKCNRDRLMDGGETEVIGGSASNKKRGKMYRTIWRCKQCSNSITAVSQTDTKFRNLSGW